MLPPDTSSTMFPWRVVVPAMQVYGCFPYRMSATSKPPTFSLPLCLWSIFAFFLQALTALETTEMLLQQTYTTQLGNIAYTSTAILSMAVLCVTPAAMGVRSGRLAGILHDLSGITEVSPPPSYRWYCKPQTLLAIFFVVGHTILSVVLTIVSFATNTTIYIMMLPPVNTLYWIGYIVPQEVTSMVFGLLGRRLVAATENTVARVSMLLAPDGSLQCETDVGAALRAVRDLEAVIREVELQKAAATRCFFPVVTTRLMIAVLLAVACPYATMTGYDIDGVTVFTLCLAYYFMVKYYTLGQNFVNQVGAVRQVTFEIASLSLHRVCYKVNVANTSRHTHLIFFVLLQVSAAEELLRDLTVKSNIDIVSFNLKVNRIMDRLSRGLSSLDMCGWYRLDYAAFLGLLNTVLTYLVIIFQMGGIRVGTSGSTGNSSDPGIEN
ncbi:uncharacterized protein LOC127002696 [Eriocheir sinensis]|uniref:uncharacterized protein LOC127002696 n=1 Tax=Eriocheir sinensis TaxID=95602 RepID=UPI0021CACA2A|nr:uncharacterized protein LOC127002696 [Eriocheir sinensis]